MRTLVLTLEYDGADYAGWQLQGEQPTVQRALEAAILRLTTEPRSVRAASRTDAGVHARGQVVAFDTDKDNIPLHGVLRGLNSYLPPSIAVQRVVVGEPGFHPRSAARGKRYRYSYLDAPARSPLLRGVAWHSHRPLDVARMQAAGQHLLGTHDFSSFRSSGCEAPHAVRTLHAVSVVREGPVVHLELVGNAFVKNMVRVIAGTLHEVGIGKRAPDALAAILAARDREAAGITAPAHGLCLEEVIFDERLPPKVHTPRREASS